MDISLPLDKMTVEEKLRIIETVWEDLKRNHEIPTPEWHLEILREREQLLDEGKSEFVGLEEFKKVVTQDITRGRPQ
jgi:hypothetical protein